MFVYLLAPIIVTVAIILGWGPRRMPARGYAWIGAFIIAMGIVEYFAGIFPTITIPFLLSMAVLAITVRLAHLALERTFPRLTNNKPLLYILIAVGVILLFSVFSFGGVFALAFIFFPLWQNMRRRGPRSTTAGPSQMYGFDAARRALARLGPLTLLTIGTVVALIAATIVTSLATSLAAAATYGSQVALVKAQTSQMLPPINATDVPIVERQSAALVLSNAIGSLGPQYHVSDRGLALVRYHQQLIWTAPLDYNNGLIWLTRHTSPGYVWTSASNPSAKPQIVLHQAYTITPSAGFSYNLGRLLYQHFPTYIIGTSDWELAPNGSAYWVTSLYCPAPGLAGLVTRVITGCALTDPTTGEVTYYPLGQQPAWVSQVVGPNFAQSEAKRYAWDRAGFLSATLTHQLATQPVHATPYNVLLKNGGLGWEIPLTSPNADDNSLSGIILVDAETNRVTYTPFTGLQNDISISQRVNGATVNSTLSAGRALLYNVSGSLAYIAPVINRSGIVQEVAIVDPKNVAQPIIASNITDALAAWQAYLISSGSGAPNLPSLTVTVHGTVQRVATTLQSGGASGATVKEYWLFLIDGHAYRASLSLSPNVVPFVHAGDQVTVTYIRGSSSPISIQSIVDSSLK
ncbi:MAG: hypothetical protein OWT28_09750 [Firmicutes bacterium]|nr:hypothetical protein [Bacillota bacterium]